MFDWNDEELANIIWDEACESDDHIVPHHDGSEGKPPRLYGNHIKKEWNQEAAFVKPAEQKKPFTSSGSNGVKVGRNSQYDANERLPTTGFGMDSWTDLSISNAAKTDPDSIGPEASNNTTEISKYDSLRDDKAQLGNGSEIFKKQHDEREESDFVDYGWVNIGSFDDLDRIFSNNDPMFGHVSLGNADELWSTSQDVTSSPEKSIPLSLEAPSLGLGELRSTSEYFETEAEYMLDQDQPFTPDQEKIKDFSYRTPHNVQASMDHIEYAGGRSKLSLKDKTAFEMIGKTPAFNSHLEIATLAPPNEFADKVNRQRKLLKIRKKSEVKSEAGQLQDWCGSWSPSGKQFQQFDGQYAPQMDQPYLSLVLSQQRQLQGPESLQYKHFSNPLLAPSVNGNVGNLYPAVPVLPQFDSGEGNHQKVSSGYEIYPGNSNTINKPPDAPAKPLTMTPQEKIEKLRRRQQMRAMLAIQKQQQQFSHPVSSTELSISQKCLHENQMQLMEGGNTEIDENLSTLPSLDPNSPIEQDNSNTVSMAIDNGSMEDIILYRLQDIIAKLDIQIRLCIRDSLFRLAQSAMQRKYATDISSTNKSSRDELEVLAKEEINSHNRVARMPDLETQTNPIDRSVAHLLFHRPLGLGKVPETPESTVSTKVPCERKAIGLMDLPMGFFPESYKDEETLSHQGSKIPCLFAEGDQCKSSTCVDTSKNASNNDAADGQAMEVETSQ